MSGPLTIAEMGVGGAEELSTLSIRTYVAAFGADFDDPAELQHHLDTTLTVPMWREYFASCRVFGARVGERLAGFLQLGMAGPREAEIIRLYVDPVCQNEGIGAALMRHVLDDPAVAAIPLVSLDVWEQNNRAQRFYRRFGFEMNGERRPFVLKSGKIDGYDLVMVRRQAAP